MRSNHRSQSTEGWNHGVLNMGGLVTLPSEAGIWAEVDASLSHTIYSLTVLNESTTKANNIIFPHLLSTRINEDDVSCF